jgi:phage-related protein
MAINIPIISSLDTKGFDKAKREFSSLEGVGAKSAFALKKAMIPAGAALAGLGGFLVSAAKGAEDARIANEKLGSVLDTMGFGAATDRVSAYAESLEKTVAVDADVIKATQTKLATFSNLTKTVGKAGGAFDRATKAALDMAAAGFGSAEGNAVQLGKALQDPIKGIAALAKSGVTFTEQEKDKIRTLTESGKLLEAQDIILKSIEGQVGGTAEASASSFDKMKFALAGVSDTFGDMLLPVIDAIAPKLAAFSKWAQENPGLMKIAVITVAALTAAVVALNIAMSLNPISLIVIGIGLLIAGLAVAYTKFEGFRKIVNLVFDGIKFGFEILLNYFKTVLGVYKGIFNGFASIWNNTIGKIQIKIPDIKGLPGRGETFGVPKIPMLAEGGIVPYRPGGTLAIVGERGPEAVVPLDRYNGGNGGGGDIYVTVQGGDPNAIVDALRRYQRQNGSIPIRVAS